MHGGAGGRNDSRARRGRQRGRGVTVCFRIVNSFSLFVTLFSNPNSISVYLKKKISNLNRNSNFGIQIEFEFHFNFFSPLLGSFQSSFSLPRPKPALPAPHPGPSSPALPLLPLFPQPQAALGAHQCALGAPTPPPGALLPLYATPNPPAPLDSDAPSSRPVLSPACPAMSASCSSTRSTPCFAHCIAHARPRHRACSATCHRLVSSSSNPPMPCSSKVTATHAP